MHGPTPSGPRTPRTENRPPPLALTPRPVNYDESAIPPYTVPDPLRFADGRPVATPADWPARRDELLTLFREHVYGVAPPPPPRVPFTRTAHVPDAIGGLADLQEFSLYPTGDPQGPPVYLLLLTPAARPAPVPVFMALNFRGNHTLHADPAIAESPNWPRIRAHADAAKDGPLDADRGSRAHRCPLATILTRGYGLATAFYGDLEPDFPNGWESGIRGALAPVFPAASHTWGAIGAWAWGLSRMLDVLAQHPAVDAARVAVLGHSRLGKTALWAAAQDPRFALAISNNSGCGGAALARHLYGETPALINAAFPHWFCANYKRYNDRESDLPVDQHELFALIAPRPVYVASAAEDRWCDPRGEFLAARHADPVYRLLGHTGLGLAIQPPLHHSVGDRIGYHIRAGKHDVTAYDWDQYLTFADRHLRPAGC